MLVEKKRKLIQLVIISVLVVTFITPVVNAEIKINSAFIPNVIASSSPSYGNLDFKIQVEKTQGQSESLTIPVTVNGTTMMTIDVQMMANETLKSVPVNIILPGATVLMINPFEKLALSDIQYEIKPNPYANPVSHIHYDIKVGNINKTITLLVYPDWSFWAIIIDIIAVAATFIMIRRSITT